MAPQPRSSIRALPPRLNSCVVAAKACLLLAMSTGCDVLAHLDLGGSPPALVAGPARPAIIQLAPKPPPPRPRGATALLSATQPPPPAPREASIAKAPRTPVLAELLPPPAKPELLAIAPGAGRSEANEPPRPSVTLVAPAAIEPASLIGRSADELVRNLGRPKQEMPIASGMTWRYQLAECTASFLLLPELATGMLKVFSYEIAPRATDEAAACLGRIASDGRANGT